MNIVNYCGTEQETELLAKCLLHRHAEDKIVGNEGQIVDFFWGGGEGGHIYDAYPRNLPDFHCFRAWNLLSPFPTQTAWCIQIKKDTDDFVDIMRCLWY